MNKKLATVLGGGMLVALIAALVGLVIVPTSKERRLLEERVDVVEKAIAERSTLLERAKEVEGRFDEVAKRHREVTIFIPFGRDMGGIVAMLTGLASARGIIIESIQFSDQANAGVVSFSSSEAAQSPFERLSFLLKARGSYQSVKSFLAAVAANARLMDVERITFVPQEEGGNMILEATVASYYRKAAP